MQKTHTDRQTGGNQVAQYQPTTRYHLPVNPLCCNKQATITRYLPNNPDAFTRVSLGKVFC